MTPQAPALIQLPFFARSSRKFVCKIAGILVVIAAHDGATSIRGPSGDLGRSSLRCRRNSDTFVNGPYLDI
jgi:hypothetical protein